VLLYKKAPSHLLNSIKSDHKIAVQFTWIADRKKIIAYFRRSKSTHLFQMQNLPVRGFNIHCAALKSHSVEERVGKS